MILALTRQISTTITLTTLEVHSLADLRAAKNVEPVTQTVTVTTTLTFADAPDGIEERADYVQVGNELEKLHQFLRENRKAETVLIQDGKDITIPMDAPRVEMEFMKEHDAKVKALGDKMLPTSYKQGD